MPGWNTITTDDHFADPDASAVLQELLATDEYSDHGQSYSAAETFEHGRSVEIVAERFNNQSTLIRFMVGNYLNNSLYGDKFTYGRVTRIRMMDANQFTEDDYHAIGFNDDSQSFPKGRVWMLDFDRNDVPR